MQSDEDFSVFNQSCLDQLSLQLRQDMLQDGFQVLASHVFCSQIELSSQVDQFPDWKLVSSSSQSVYLIELQATSQVEPPCYQLSDNQSAELQF